VVLHGFVSRVVFADEEVHEYRLWPLNINDQEWFTDVLFLLSIDVDSWSLHYWNEHGTIYAISSDFGDQITTQHLD